MTILFATLLVAGALALVLWPFVSHRVAGARLEGPADDLRRRLRRGRERLYEEIRALQQERFMRDLTDDEYRAQLDELRLRAAEFMREEGTIEQTLSAMDAEIDDAMRRAGDGTGESDRG